MPEPAGTLLDAFQRPEPPSAGSVTVSVTVVPDILAVTFGAMLSTRTTGVNAGQILLAVSWTRTDVVESGVLLINVREYDITSGPTLISVLL